MGLVNLPPPVNCEFCGAPLKYTGYNIGGGIWWSPFTLPCTCEKGAEKYAREQAAERARVEAERQEKENRRRRETIAAIIGDSGMGARFLNRRFDTFAINDNNRQAAATAKRYADSFPAMLPSEENREPGRNGLFIIGRPGTGKTHLAAAIANQLIEQQRGVICMTMIDLLERIRRTFNGAGSEASVLHLYKSVQLLVIDDIGKEPPTEWAISTIYNIINGRYEAYMPTIITSNYSPDELITRMTPRETHDRTSAEAILDRLKEMCRAIHLSGESWRGK